MRDRRGGSGDFALVDLRDLRLDAASTRFVETEGVPSDAKVVGHTWEKANKDGSPDRRFASNRQIPIALYGEIVLRSPGGIHEAWMFSDHDAVQEFAACYRRLQQALADLARKPTPGGDELPFAAAEPASRYVVPAPPKVGGAHEYTLGAAAVLGAVLSFGSAHLGANPWVAPGADPTSPAMTPPSVTEATPVPAEVSSPAVAWAAAEVTTPAAPASVAPTASGERVVTKQGANIRVDANGSAAVVRTVS